MTDKATYDSHLDTWEHTLSESTLAERVTRHEGTYKWGSPALSSVAFMKIFYIAYASLIHRKYYTRQRHNSWMAVMSLPCIIFSDSVSWFAYWAQYFERQYVILLFSHSTPKTTATTKTTTTIMITIVIIASGDSRKSSVVQ